MPDTHRQTKHTDLTNRQQLICLPMPDTHRQTKQTDTTNRQQLSVFRCQIHTDKQNRQTQQTDSSYLSSDARYIQTNKTDIHNRQQLSVFRYARYTQTNKTDIQTDNSYLSSDARYTQTNKTDRPNKQTKVIYLPMPDIKVLNAQSRLFGIHASNRHSAISNLAYTRFALQARRSQARFDAVT